MADIHIKLLSDDAYNYLRKNKSYVNNCVKNNDDIDWLLTKFGKQLFIEKKLRICDFYLENITKDKGIETEYNNSIKIYESLKHLPGYILASSSFWLWLHLEKFYLEVKSMTDFSNNKTIENTWLLNSSKRRGLLVFGLLSRTFFHVFLTIEEEKEDKYLLTRWVLKNKLRIRQLTIRTYSSQKHIVRGAIKGEMKAVDECNKLDNGYYYEQIAKEISFYGSVRLLDAVTEEDIENFVYDKMMDMAKKDKLI